MIDQILEFLKNNQFASGGLLMGAGAIFYRHGTTLLFLLKNLLYRRMLVEMSIDSKHYDNFDAVMDWISFELKKNNKNLYAITTPANAFFVNEQEKFIPRSGRWFIKTSIGRAYISISRERIDAKTSYGAESKDVHSITISTLASNRDALIKKIEGLSFAIGSEHVFNLIDGHATVLDITPNITTKDKVILKQGLMEDIEQDINNFLVAKERYKELGLAYKRVYLLTGPPGNGKTSIIKWISNKINFPIALGNLNGLTIGNLKSFTNRDSKKAILVCEDVDREILTKYDCNKDEEVPVPNASINIGLNKTLNALDGICTPDNLIIFMTCNNIEKLDPALVRPGRIDRIIQIDNATKDQARRLFLKFFPGELALAQEFASNVEDNVLSMSRLQQHLMSYSTAQEVINNSKNLTNE